MSKIHEITDTLNIPEFGEMSFEGDPKSVAVQFCHAVWTLRALADHGGCAGIDYESLAQITASSTSTAMPGSMYAEAVDRLRSLETVAREAFDGESDRDVLAWTLVRSPMTRVVDEDTGVRYWKTSTYDEAGLALKREGFYALGREATRRVAKRLDGLIDDALRRHDWRIQ